MANNFKITLSDGTVIKDLEMNGNNFVSKTPLTADNFNGKLSHVVIDGPDNVDDAGLRGEHGPMMLVEDRVQVWPDGYYFVLMDIPESTLKELKVNSRLDYIEMMEDL